MTMNKLRRLATFTTWPLNIPISAITFAGAGFEYTGKDDGVICTDCQLVIDNWKKADIPLNEHHRRSPTCSRLAELPVAAQVPAGSFTNSASNHTTMLVEIPNLEHIPKVTDAESVNTSISVIVEPTTMDRRNPDFGLLKQEKVRLQTFFDWPQYAKLNPAELVRQGFFYIGERDKVQCCFCRGVLFNWLDGDQPHAEHQKHFPNCHFVRGNDVGNVVLEYSASVEYAANRYLSNVSDVQDAAATNMTQVSECSTANANTNSTSLNQSKCKDVIERAKKSTQARAVLSMGYSEQLVRHAISMQLTQQGSNFDSAELLLRSLLSLSNESHIALPTMPTMTKLSDRPTTEFPAEQTQHVERVAAVATHEPTSVRVNEKPLENLRMSGGLTSSDEAIATGDNKQKKKKNKNKNKTGKTMLKVNKTDVEGIKETFQSATCATEKQMAECEAAEMAEDLRLLEENKGLRESRTCKVCMDKEVNTVFLPCGHLVCCNECAANIHSCAVCRTLIRGTVRIFLS